MSSLILVGSPEISIVLKRNARARRLSLRVSRLDGRVTMSLPKWTPEAEALGFAREKEDWIRRQLKDQTDVFVPEIGGHVLFEGDEVSLVSAKIRSARFEDGVLLVPGDPARAPARVAAFLKVMARQRLIEACDFFAGEIGRNYGRVTIRDTRSRWGSCSGEGNLMFSWRLIMAPRDVLSYVAAHEVAHLAEMNHSAAFWNVVEDICPEYAVPRRWLKKNGARLHAYRFGN
ncbi:MAG: M48 family metallopeptidase [Paracoccaceae bacterium]